MTQMLRRSLVRSAVRLAIIALPLVVAACGSSTTPDPPSAPYSQTDLVVGTGAVINTGNRATVSYALWLYDPTKPDGKGAAVEAGNYTFTVGAGAVIQGWDRGVPGMRVGGQRRLVIPPDLAYGSRGSGSIGPNTTLVFDITALSVV